MHSIDNMYFCVQPSAFQLVSMVGHVLPEIPAPACMDLWGQDVKHVSTSEYSIWFVIVLHSKIFLREMVNQMGSNDLFLI